ncbi:hypothetical protein M9Y10_029283 [Tritrichomonas musculus]|uniref:Myb-like DNA-binding domain containing protein n=1 Tax=Tritrichomonas musculus TaxID=1915356 RepID=A0ABR2KLW4_9EUKA
MNTDSYIGLNLLVDVAISYVDGFTSHLTDAMRDLLSKNFSDYLHKRITYEQCQKVLLQQIGRDDALVQLNEIMTLPEEPLVYHDQHELDFGISNSNDGKQVSPIRKKTRTWTGMEDKRLLAGVARYGTDNWQMVAHFVGNGRNRAQCSQRWTRGLNPKISKKNWTVEDDKQLQELVELYGDKSWTKIANILGNRSDVQCRYHYRQLTNSNEEANNKIDPSSDGGPGNSKVPNEANTPNSLSSFRNSFATMSTDQLVVKLDPLSLPKSQLISEGNESEQSGIPLTASRKYLSSPGLTMPKIYGVSHMTPMLRHSHELQQKQQQEQQRLAMLNNTNQRVSGSSPLPRPLWGVCGADQESLNIFLSQFE